MPSLTISTIKASLALALAAAAVTVGVTLAGEDGDVAAPFGDTGAPVVIDADD